MLRFGLFDAGRIGRIHGAVATADPGAILGGPGIDAVVIASPTPRMSTC